MERRNAAFLTTAPSSRELAVPQALTEGVMERRNAAFLTTAPSSRELAVPQALTEGVMERRIRRLPCKGSLKEGAGCELARRLRE